MKIFLVEIPWRTHRGRLITLAGQIEAESWEEAERMCKDLGYDMVGEWYETIEARPEYDEIIRAMLEKTFHTEH